MKPPLDELLFAVELNRKNRLNAGGVVTYSFAHKYGVMHTTVLIVLIHRGSRTITLMQRPHSKRLYPGCWDITGGHVTADLRAIGSPEKLEQVIDRTAVAEASEEAKVSVDGAPVMIDESSIVRFSDYGELFAESPLNVERSTGYCLFLDERSRVVCADENENGQHETLNQRQVILPELKAEYGRNPDSFADGAGRLLERLLDSSDPVTKRFEATIEQHS